MTSVARPSAAGHAGHGFARPLAKNETPAEGFDALIASLAGGAVAQAPVDPAQGEKEGEGHRDAHPHGEAGKGADVALLATLNAQNVAVATPSSSVVTQAATSDASHSNGSVAAPPSLAVLTATTVRRNVDERSAFGPSESDALRTGDATTSGAATHATLAIDAATTAEIRRTATNAQASPQSARETASSTHAPTRNDARDVMRVANAATTITSNETHAMLRTVPDDDVRDAMASLFETKRDARSSLPPSRLAIDLARERQHAFATTTLTALDAPGVSPADDPATAFSTLLAMRKADATLTDRANARDALDSISTPSASWSASTLSTASNAGTAGATTHPASPSFDPTAWSAALARQIASAAAAEAREASVTFEPKGLGPIEVRVRVDAARVDVRFAIEHPVTVNLVRDALPDLEKLLAQSGMTLGDANVAQQQASGGGRQAFAAPASTSSREHNDDGALAPLVEARPRARVGLLDDFV